MDSNCMEKVMKGEVTVLQPFSDAEWVNMPPALISRWLRHQRVDDSDSGERGRSSIAAFHSCHFELGGLARAGLGWEHAHGGTGVLGRAGVHT